MEARKTWLKSIEGSRWKTNLVRAVGEFAHSNKEYFSKSGMMTQCMELTEKALQILRVSVFRPVCILQVPHSPLLPGQQVLYLQASGGVTARVSAEAGSDLEPSVGDGVVP